MSRWIETFNNHAFQESWKNLQTEIISIKATSTSSTEETKELARLKKIITYLAELVSASDPEIVPLALWDLILNQSNAALSNVGLFKTSPNIIYLTSANQQLDEINKLLSPYIKSAKKGAQAAGKAFNTYAKFIDETLEVQKTEAKLAIQNTVELEASAKKLFVEMQTIQNKLIQVQDELITGDTSVKSKAEKFLTEFIAEKQEIHNFYEKLTAGNQENSAIILQIETAKSQAIENDKIIKDAKEENEVILDDLRNFHSTIFGIVTEHGEREGGLREEIQNKKAELSVLKNEQNRSFQAMKERIEGLIPGATTAGLATAYETLKSDFSGNVKSFTLQFYGALVLILLISTYTVFGQFAFWKSTVLQNTGAIELLKLYLYKLPITAPFIWFAVFTSKRRSENRRLEQEYAHKEALAKSYASYKQQIEELGEGNNERLLSRLLETMIDTVGFNASKTLDGKHLDEHPYAQNQQEIRRLIQRVMEENITPPQT